MTQLPPLYKFLDLRGAKLTLGNLTFKFAKPTDFNDIEDLTVQTVFPEMLEAALSRIEGGFTDVILRHLHEPPTCSSPMKERVALLQHVYLTNPDAAAVVNAEIATQSGPVLGSERMRLRVAEFLKEINEGLQDFRVLCVSTHIDSEKLWSRYAENQKGIALRIEPDLRKDSKFQLFRPVKYRDVRPSFYEDTLDFVAHSMFGDQEAHRLKAIENIIYTKTRKWEYEGEYRLAIPIMPDEQPWNTLGYYREEITELYLGMAVTTEDRRLLVKRARVINPQIKVFQGSPAFGRVRFREL